MTWFDRRDSGPSDGPWSEEVLEMLDPYHQRASIEGGGRIMIQPGKVLENIAAAMERIDLDINTEFSVEEDVASLDELLTMVQHMLMGPTLAVHVVNTAMRIITPRYPAELVRRPLLPEYDVRKIYSVSFDDEHQEIAKTIFNRRIASESDLVEDDVDDDMAGLDDAGQLQVFLALFFMFGSKVGAIKYTTES